MYKKIQLISLFVILVFIFPTFAHAIKSGNPTFNGVNAQINALLKRPYKTVYVTIPQGKNPADVIQAELNKIKASKVPTKLVLPKGTFKLTSTLTVYKNTWLSVPKETTLIRSFNGTMLKNLDATTLYEGYNGENDIIIEGGTWDVNGDEMQGSDGFSIGHSQRILIQNLTMKDVNNGNAINLAGNENVMIRNSKFLGFKDSTSDKSHYYSEAIHLNGTFAKDVFGKDNAGRIDGTTSSSIIVENNYFGNSTTKGMQPWGTGVGSRNATLTKPYKNILIQKNVFEKMTYASLRMTNWYQADIIGNTFNQNARGVYINSSPYSYDKNGKVVIKATPNTKILISENSFRNGNNRAVEIRGAVFYPVKEVSILENTITNTKTALYKTLAEGVMMDTYYVKTGGIFGIENVKLAQKDFAVPSTYTKTGKRHQMYQVVTGGIYSESRAKAYSNIFKAKYGWNNKVVPTEKSGFYKIIITGFWSKATADNAVTKLSKDVGFWSYTEKGEVKDEYFITFGALSTQKEATAIINKLKENRKWWSYSYKTIVR